MIRPIASEVSFVENITEPAAKIVESAAKKVVDVVAGPIAPLVNPIVENIIDKGTSSFRLTKLPKHDRDFATDWFYSTQKETVAENIIDEYNTYLQVLEELSTGKIILPEGFEGNAIANDIKTFILQDFRRYGVVLNTANNLAHRAYYSHCVKRAIDSVRQGEYTGPDGYTKKKPEIADAIDNRINQILFDKMINKSE